MKNVCKKWMKTCWLFGFVFACLFAVCSCSTEADGDVVLLPDTNRLIAFKLYPNDMAKNDSAAANFARGIKLVVHPGASYQLSFDVDSTQPAPELQLFRTYNLNDGTGRVRFARVRALSPTVVGNRYVYQFNCEENKMAIWYTSLNVDGQYYEGRVENIRFTGVGSYSNHFSINLIVVGAMQPTEDGLLIDELATQMLARFREKYYGAVIDTLYVRFAENHPTLGSKYPANLPWVAGYNSEDVFVSELVDWPEEELRNTLPIVLVNSIDDDEIMGLSHLFSGSMMGEDKGAVVVGEFVNSKTFGTTQLLTSNNIIMTAIHETGHFFGLRHTSTTVRDLDQEVKKTDGTVAMIGDWSNIEDGLTDTPFCEFILRNDLFSKQTETRKRRSDIVYRSSEEYIKANLNACQDKNNIMFPVTVDERYVVSFSQQQMELIQQSLSIIPH